MGTDASICAARGLRKMRRKGDEEKRRALVEIRIRSSLLLLLIFACFAGKSFGQDIESLSRKIQNGTTEEKRDALYETRNLQSEAASRIAIPALSDPDEIVRATAASSVVFLPKDESARLLFPLLIDKSEFVRREAAFALGEVGSKTSTASLLDLLQKDKSREVKSAAAAALGRIGDPAAVGGLTSVLSKKPKEDDAFVRRSAARSIGQIAQIIRCGKMTAVTPQDFLNEKYKGIESGKVNAISEQFSGFRNATPTLIRVLQNRRESDDTRREAAFALGAIGDASAILALRGNLNSKDNYLGEICKEALLKIPKPQ